MIPAEVKEAARAAGRHLSGQPVHVALDVPAARPQLLVPRAIYLAYTRAGELHYVGKIDRATGTAGARISEHLRSSPRKRRAWRTVWLVPLSSALPVDELMKLERALIHRYSPAANYQHAAA